MLGLDLLLYKLNHSLCLESAGVVGLFELNHRLWLQSVEAARECGMACVVVAGRNPLYELTAADLVVRQLQELSLVNLKQLFQLEDRVDPRVSTFLHIV